MKIDSPLFDSIRVKPGKDRRVKNDGPVCQWAGCKEKATNFAPKGPDTPGRWHYCMKHVREYNQSYNFFAGMNDAAVLAFQKDALTGHRPTWKMGTGKQKIRPDLGALGYSHVLVRHLADDQSEVLASYERLAEVRTVLALP